MPESRAKRVGQTIGGGALVILVPLLGLFLIALLIRGMVWISDKAMPWLNIAAGVTLLVLLFVLLPMSAFRKTRGIGGVGCIYASYVFGVELWAYSCLFVAYTWGYVALGIGLVFAGVGVVPVALLAALFRREWSVLWELIFAVLLTFGTRSFGLWMVGKADRDAEEAALAEPY